MTLSQHFKPTIQEPLDGLSYFQIPHDPAWAGLWIPRGADKLRSLKRDNVVKRLSYRGIKHPICNVMGRCGFGSKLRHSKRRSLALRDDDSEEGFDNTLMKEDEDAGPEEGDISDEDSDGYQGCMDN